MEVIKHSSRRVTNTMGLLEIIIYMFIWLIWKAKTLPPAKACDWHITNVETIGRYQEADMDSMKKTVTMFFFFDHLRSYMIFVILIDLFCFFAIVERCTFTPAT